jgi:NAD(P)-dependent dehydrogenase (short-subunit alcohol dehydrogenase family)
MFVRFVMHRLNSLGLFSLTLFVLCAGLAVLCAGAANAEANGRKAVLVTGASTGIGRKVTERLAGEGYFVYAGARNDADLQALGAIKNVQAVRLDVTNVKDIATAVDAVSKGGRGLYGIVNNAGIGTAGPVIGGNDSEFELAMNVNALGPYRITKAFGPLVIQSKGRIVNIGSVSGILAGKTLAAYAMSKHAMEAFTDSLASEMESRGVQVSVVEPGSYNTAIAKNAVQRLAGDPRRADMSMFKQPDDVAAAVDLALFEPKPKRRYLVVPTLDQAERTIRKQIEQLVQLNEGQPFTYDRNALVKMLDEALAHSRSRTQ